MGLVRYDRWKHVRRRDFYQLQPCCALPELFSGQHHPGWANGRARIGASFRTDPRRHRPSTGNGRRPLLLASGKPFHTKEKGLRKQRLRRRRQRLRLTKSALCVCNEKASNRMRCALLPLLVQPSNHVSWPGSQVLGAARWSPKSALTTASKLLRRLELGYTLLSASPSGAGMDRDGSAWGTGTRTWCRGKAGGRVIAPPPSLNTVLLMESRGVKW